MTAFAHHFMKSSFSFLLASTIVIGQHFDQQSNDRRTMVVFINTGKQLTSGLAILKESRQHRVYTFAVQNPFQHDVNDSSTGTVPNSICRSMIGGAIKQREYHT